jgi:hypothetical protein
MSMSYYCWATLILPDYQNDIIAEMVQKGYQVSPATENDKIIHSGKGKSAGYLFVIKVEIPDKHLDKKSGKTDAKIVGRDFSAALDNAKAKYYSALVTMPGDGWFAVSNVVLPEESPAPAKPIEAES